MNPKLIIITILSILFLVRCSGGKNDDNRKVIAKVDDKFLYEEDLLEFYKDKKLDKKDSIKIVNNFINNWLRKEIVLNKALKNLPESKKDKSKKLEDYYNSLIVYEYQSQVIKQNLDTVVSEQELKKYYLDNRELFKLRKDIIKHVFIKISNETNSRKVKRLYTSTKAADLDALNQYCIMNSADYLIDYENWYYFDFLQKKISKKIKNSQDLLRDKKSIIMKDSNYKYFISIRDYKLKGEIAPFSFTKDKIRSMVLNKRKMKIIKDMEESLFLEGIEKGSAKIFRD